MLAKIHHLFILFLKKKEIINLVYLTFFEHVMCLKCIVILNVSDISIKSGLAFFPASHVSVAK